MVSTRGMLSSSYHMDEATAYHNRAKPSCSDNALFSLFDRLLGCMSLSNLELLLGHIRKFELLLHDWRQC